METVGAIVACGAAAAFGYPAGMHWARDGAWCVLIGIVVGAACALGYLVALLWVGELFPHSLDGYGLGVRFLVLLPVVPLFAVPAAWFGYRKSLGISLF